MMVISPDESYHFDAGAFARAASERWAPHVDVRHQSALEHPGWWAVIDRPATGTFLVSVVDDGSFMNIVADEVQTLEALEFACTLLPDPLAGKVWAVDTDGMGKAELQPGMTADEIAAAYELYEQ
jgi:hypothetical protein